MSCRRTQSELAVLSSHSFARGNGNSFCVREMGIVDPATNGLTGPGGVFSPAGRRFYKPRAPEGCLLILTGNGEVLHFDGDTDSITVRTPGPLHFVANDDRAPDFPTAKGFDDNIGSMSVTIRIRLEAEKKTM